MSRKYRVPVLAALVGIFFLAIAFTYLKSTNIPVLQPAGIIGHKERNLILLAIGLSLVVVIPVYAMLFGFALRYREGNKKAKYEPGFDRSRVYESIWWGVPLAIITILAVVTWNSSRDLDPFKPLASNAKPITVQVVALDWKWLFIYPEQNIASVNFLEIPVNRPVNFQITADAPMNSFWIPQLGGQIYAMSGMSTQMHLMADKAGDYQGSSANISGSGFAAMHFITRAASQSQFNSWVESTKSSANSLTQNSYNSLAAPGTVSSPSYYSGVDSGLYDSIVSKFGHSHGVLPEGEAS